MTWEDRGWRCRVAFGYDGDGMRLWKREDLPRPLGVVVRLTLYAGYGFEEGYVEELVPHEAGEMAVPGDVCGKVVGVTERGFTSQREEISFGPYDFKARYLSPGLGRFISPDSIVPDPSNPQALNRYAYVYNNPLKLIRVGILGFVLVEHKTMLALMTLQEVLVPLKRMKMG